MSKYVIGVHDENDKAYQGWEIRPEGIGHNPDHKGGTDYSGARHTVIARLNDGYPPTIPAPVYYPQFAQRCANFVRNSRGCSRWIIGNETNHSSERGSGPPITPALYAQCYALCRAAIRQLPGHEQDEVIVAAPAPYNNQTQYPTNPTGDWVRYWVDILTACGTVDAVALHAYSSSHDPAIITSDAKMGKPGEPFAHLSSEFHTYHDFLLAMPKRLWGIPIYMTEANPGARGTPWQNVDNGWCNAALDDVAAWNAVHPERAVRCLAFYSWSLRGDGMGFKNKQGVVNDILRAAARGVTWPDVPVEPEPPGPEPPEPEQPEPVECKALTRAQVDQIVRDALAEYTGQMRTIVREEIDRTVWRPGVG